MATPPRQQRTAPTAYAGLDFIKAAFCPLEFTATLFKHHPQWKEFGSDDGLADIEVGDALNYARKFPYTNKQGHRVTGTQMTNAVFGMAPTDFDLFIGLYTYLKKLPALPEDGRTYLTLDFIARQVSLPATSAKDYMRLRSRIFRLSYVKYTNSAVWDPKWKEYVIANFGFFNLLSLSRLSLSRRPIVMEWDRSLLRMVERAAFLTFDYEFYRTLSPALRRVYLIANRDGWNQQHSSIFMADDFAIHQIGYSESPELRRLRLQKLKKLLADAEALDIIRPYAPWHGYLQPVAQGARKGDLALRWSRGPKLKTKPDADDGRRFIDRAENDALFAQVQELKDEDGKPVDVPVYRTLVSKYGRERMQKHILVILAQKENDPGSFTKSEVAAFINRLQHDHPEPDWYRDLKRAERLSPFEKTQPNQLSMEMYDTFFRE